MWRDREVVREREIEREIVIERERDERDDFRRADAFNA